MVVRVTTSKSESSSIVTENYSSFTLACSQYDNTSKINPQKMCTFQIFKNYHNTIYRT